MTTLDNQLRFLESKHLGEVKNLKFDEALETSKKMKHLRALKKRLTK